MILEMLECQQDSGHRVAFLRREKLGFTILQSNPPMDEGKRCQLRVWVGKGRDKGGRRRKAAKKRRSVVFFACFILGISIISISIMKQTGPRSAPGGRGRGGGPEEVEKEVDGFGPRAGLGEEAKVPNDCKSYVLSHEGVPGFF